MFRTLNAACFHAAIFRATKGASSLSAARDQCGKLFWYSECFESRLMMLMKIEKRVENDRVAAQAERK